MRWQNRAFLALIFVAVGVGFAGGAVRTIGYIACAAAALLVAASLLFERRFAAAGWWRRAVDPIVLSSPFEERWRVDAGGPDPRHNHHHGSSDQEFAYDFAPVEAGDTERVIVAPCDGFVAWSEDRRRRGNYVSIETDRGYVIVGHLAEGSIAVRVADEIRAGTPIGRWSAGERYVHVHAQDRPQMAEEIARGIPIAFLDRKGIAQVLEFGDVLEPESSPA
jgi:hypothetical protein